MKWHHITEHHSQITTLTHHRSPQNQPHYFIRTHHLNKRPLCWSHQNKGSINQGCHKRFYRHMFFWYLYFLPFETSATASCGYMSYEVRPTPTLNIWLYLGRLPGDLEDSGDLPNEKRLEGGTSSPIPSKVHHFPQNLLSRCKLWACELCIIIPTPQPYPPPEINAFLRAY